MSFDDSAPQYSPAEHFFAVMAVEEPRTPPSQIHSTYYAQSNAPSSSYLYASFLPSSVQSRISRFRRNGWSPPDSPTPRSKQPTTDLTTLRHHGDTLIRHDHTESSSVESLSPPSSTSRRPSPRRPTPQEPSKEYRYARHGIDMLETILLESQFSTADDPRNKALLRQHYVQTCSMLLYGLPEDLSEQETESLKMALAPEQQLLLLQQQQSGLYPDGRSHSAPHRRPHSLPHRVSASLILLLFLTFQALVPYLKTLLRTAYRFERNHHISEQAFAVGVSAAEATWRFGAGAARTMCSGGDGKLAQIVVAGLVWWSTEISAGVNEGMGKGLDSLGLERRVLVDP